MIFTALPQKDWDEVEASLADAFRRAQEAARAEEPTAADRNTHARQPTQEGAAVDLPAHDVFPRA